MFTSSPEERAAARADMSACADLLRVGSRSFHAAGRLLPRAVREPATALYAFCRVADDAVDGGGDPRAALAHLRTRLDRCRNGRPEDHPVDRAFARMIAAHAVPWALPEGLIEGLAWDAEGRRYETLGDLHAYAARVAGTVGAMMTLVMGRREPEVLARACDLGVAMQLTNIARDVGEDARMGRIYMPLADLRAAGIEPDAFLADPRPSPALAGVVRGLLVAAEGLYERAAGGVAELPPACRPGIEAARLLYREIGREVERRGCDSVTARAVVPAARKAQILARAAAAAVPQRAPRSIPALAQTRFIVDAVSGLHAPAARGEPGSFLRLLALFERLERVERGPLSG
ncbi:phytoene/squalene synthase family protein [Salinarimonas soli]|uniref:Phytoene/squalene synthase family protein n=1 Tax=Salinarimonas soli TaxID=1638099 RepID=A0A5B2VET3_9HYPH|nr:phytoene/squalene synthase family protein [Salinarimonas soli]KAA2238063.1 phytoene/squalene synthase family protein [Salinarimonas soli]